jgi:GNAT superfamily N-acetyltransferase
MNANAWRPMRPADIPAIFAVSQRVHVDHPERGAVLAEKFSLFPAGCFVLAVHEEVVGYAFSHPWHGAPPALDTLLGALPAAPSRYFIPDVTLDAGVRGKGYAAAIVPKLVDAARAFGVPRLMLVAVNGAEGFWSQFGFRAVEGALQREAQAKYGAGAVAMERAS